MSSVKNVISRQELDHSCVTCQRVSDLSEKFAERWVLVDHRAYVSTADFGGIDGNGRYLRRFF